MESSPPSSTTPKAERKIVEKNRRKHMKTLYSKLYSLLPNHSSKEVLPLPDQIDEAEQYIKSLQKKLEKSKEKKKYLMGRKRPHACIESHETNTRTLKSPQIEIQEMSPGLNVVFINGLPNQSMFYEIIHMIHQELGAEVINASFSAVGNSILHVVHPQIDASAFNYGTTRLSERLKVFVHGSTSEEKSQSTEELWDFEILPEIWDFEILM
ncbi:transcription factor bHLH162-like [Cornus florida]|uniref:transcription factor bHLH162-like n=1 Tax=Cornus florida TaxID=4283 RepID=UPI0028972F94|nr:transcription factor bHLH162-like [Cornus florida]